MKSTNQIGLFLHQTRMIIEQRGIVFVNRVPSMQFISDRGMTISDLKILVQSLTANDCFDGPESDRDQNFSEFTVAEFSPFWEGEQIYLKLSICSEQVVCKCLSIKEFKDRCS